MDDQFRRQGRLRGLSIHRLLPNLVTLASLCAGLTGLRFAMTGDLRHAVLAIMAAALLDSLDGRLARRLNVTSRFGAELDSLSDFVCFGVVPALVMYLAGMQAAGALGWAVTLMFPICSALRLARFNTALFAETAPPAWSSQFFTGVPAPAGALLVLLPLMASFEFDWAWLREPVIGGLFMVGVGALMVSRLPTYSLKSMRIPRQHVLPVMLGGALLAALLASKPWATMPLLGCLYLATLPMAWRARRQLELSQPATAAAPDVTRGSDIDDPSVIKLRASSDDRG